MSHQAPRGSRAALICGLGIGILLLSGTVSRAGGPNSITWQADYQQAQAEAASSARPLWVQVTGPWCTYCRQMEREALVSPEVVRLAQERYVPVIVRSDLREDLVQRLGVQGLPATLILSPTGTELARHEGYATPPEFLGFLKRSLAAPGVQPPSPHRARPAPVALAGYCPVSMIRDHHLIAGRAGLALRYDGRIYRFANAPARDAFLETPEAFLPVNQGRCVVSHVDEGQDREGNPRLGVLYNGRAYLFVDQAARDRFAKSPSTYADADLAEHGYCPHCRRLGNQRVPGSQRYAVTHKGQRYLFPDPEHREAFLASPDRYRR